MLNNIRHFMRHGRTETPASSSSSLASQRIPTNANTNNKQHGHKKASNLHHVEDYKSMATKFVNEEQQNEEVRKQRSRKSIERYKIDEKIGEGAFSVVYKAFDRMNNNEPVAIKVIKKYQMDEKQMNNVIKEVNIMKQLNHPNIVRLIDFIENEQYYYIVQELVGGGEIFNQVVNFTYFSEDLSRHIIIQIAEALLYMHEQAGIVHRDLKPENIFFKQIKFIPNDNGAILRKSDNPATKKDEGKFVMNYGGGGIGIVKIGDFGLSKQLQFEDASLKTPCGTVGYTAPEIVRDQRYSKEVDVWALGCVLYILLCGFPPFFNDNIDELTKAVARGQFTFLSPWWDEITDGAKHCVSKLLTVNPKERYTIRDLLNDPWILEFLQRSDIKVETPLDSSYSDSINNPMEVDFGEELSRTQHNKEMFTPAVIAMKEAMDITTATLRMQEERKPIANPQVWRQQPKELNLNLNDSSILARRKKIKA